MMPFRCRKFLTISLTTAAAVLRGIDRIVSHIRPLRAWFGKMDATHVSERDIDRYIKARQKAGRSNTTINRELQYLGQSMRWPRTRSLLPTSP